MRIKGKNMRYAADSGFSEGEKAVNRQLNCLFDQWSKELGRLWDGYNADYFVTDGFFPAYHQQRPRVLFIGREVLDIMGQSYINIFLQAFKQNLVGGKTLNKSLNRHSFYRRIFKITYGLTHGCPDWKDIPPASVMADTFGTPEGISFAFMNLSKLSHEYADNPAWKADMTLMDSFVQKTSECGQNYFQREIEILDPDIIITMNLEQWLSALGTIHQRESLSPDVAMYALELPKRAIPLLDCWHFSAIKRDLDNFYRPVCEACKHLSGDSSFRISSFVH